jgi:hypothetical protein
MNYIGIGKNGGKVIANTAETAPTGANTFAGIYTLTETVIAAAPGNIAGIAGVTIPADRMIEGNFKTIELTSGSVIAYNSHN